MVHEFGIDTISLLIEMVENLVKKWESILRLFVSLHPCFDRNSFRFNESVNQSIEECRLIALMAILKLLRLHVFVYISERNAAFLTNAVKSEPLLSITLRLRSVVSVHRENRRWSCQPLVFSTIHLSIGSVSWHFQWHFNSKQCQWWRTFCFAIGIVRVDGNCVAFAVQLQSVTSKTIKVKKWKQTFKNSCSSLLVNKSLKNNAMNRSVQKPNCFVCQKPLFGVCPQVTNAAKKPFFETITSFLFFSVV